MSKATSMRRASAASLMGSVLEWYDFYLYGTAAALVLGKLYFPHSDPSTATILALLTFASGFLTRPVGAVIFGHFGDRVGRKSMLVITMMIMGGATLGIGLVPTYESWGIWASVTLVALRLTQGVAIGGEWGGATLLTVENSPVGRRGFYGSVPQLGAPIGLLLSAGVYAIVSQLPDAQFLSWGWRVPFLLSGLLLVAGLWVRLGITETVAFTAVKEQGRKAALPIVTLLRYHWKETLLALGARLADAATFNVINVFAISYASSTLHLSGSVVLTGFTISSAVQILLIPLFGSLSDRIGRRPVYIAGAALCGVGVFGYFWALSTASTVVIWVAIILMHAVGTGLMFAIQSSFFSEMFGTDVRYSGISVGYQMAALVGGAPTPAIAAALVAWASGASWPVSVYLLIMCAITVGCVLVVGETRKRDLVRPAGADTEEPEAVSR